MKSTSNFNCSQQELYIVCRMGWQACRENLAGFSKLKARYTEGYIAERLAEVEAAMAIPNEKTRRDKPKTERIMMEESAKDCLDYFQTLKVYIEDAFPENLQKAKIEAAGQSYYLKAQNLNRDALSNLNDCATQFIQNNAATLKADENMPDAFLTDYLNVKKEFDNRQMNFITSNTEAKDTTDENTKANNDIYKKLTAMFKDAQRVFVKDAFMRRYFTFSDMLTSAIGYSVAGLRGTVTRLADGLPIVGAVVSINNKNKTVVTDEAGKYDIPQLANGLYSVTISAEGFKEVTIENYDVKPSVYNKLDVIMEAVLIEKRVLVEA